MKALSSAISFLALAGTLAILPGCGGGDKAVPPTDAGTDVIVTDPGMDDAMEGPALDADPAGTDDTLTP